MGGYFGDEMGKYKHGHRSTKQKIENMTGDLQRPECIPGIRTETFRDVVELSHQTPVARHTYRAHCGTSATTSDKARTFDGKCLKADTLHPA